MLFIKMSGLDDYFKLRKVSVIRKICKVVVGKIGLSDKKEGFHLFSPNLSCYYIPTIY